IHPPSAVIEFLIPVTIFITSISNLRYAGRTKDPVPGHGWRYLFAALFGLIHGMGFSTYFKMILNEGESLIGPLLMFNVGVEIGQILIIAVFLTLAFFVQSAYKIRQRDWILFFSGLAAGISFIIAAEASEGLVHVFSAPLFQR
ncbi:MAG: hypothetical protein RL226_1386, partial [Bacteroidota bacterium]